jgi:polyhydroxyalkanoate synthesis regulator phasin
VEKARKRLFQMNEETVNAIRSKQAARLVLAKEAEMVRNMVQEGLLTPQHAEEFLEEISHDTQEIELERNRMYREHAKLQGQRRWQAKLEEYQEVSSSSSSLRQSFLSSRWMLRDTSMTVRPSFLNAFTPIPTSNTTTNDGSSGPSSSTSGGGGGATATFINPHESTTTTSSTSATISTVPATSSRHRSKSNTNEPRGAMIRFVSDITPMDSTNSHSSNNNNNITDDDDDGLMNATAHSPLLSPDHNI